MVAAGLEAHMDMWASEWAQRLPERTAGHTTRVGNDEYGGLGCQAIPPRSRMLQRELCVRRNL